MKDNKPSYEELVILCKDMLSELENAQQSFYDPFDQRDEEYECLKQLIKKAENTLNKIGK